MNKSYLIAFAMVLAIVLWMGSGLLRESDDPTDKPVAMEPSPRVLVQTKTQVAEYVQLELTIQGHVEPNREVMIRSDIAGRVISLLVDDGQYVEAGTVLAQLDPEDRLSRLAREKALLASRKNTYERVKSLVTSNYQSKSAVEQAYADLKSAEASVAIIETELKKLKITAPFSGVVDRLFIESGSHVMSNGEVARFVDNNPLVVVAPVAQQNITKLTKGSEASVQFAVGSQRKGTLRYISPLANEQTRTFRVEIQVENSELDIPAGISAEVVIPASKTKGHFVSPAILTLDEKGQMGVKTVTDENEVVFNPVSIIRASQEGVWVDGLPDPARIITVGQGFVEAGTVVDVAEQGAGIDKQALGVARYDGISQ